MRVVGMHGYERFTPTHIRDALALFGWTLGAHEIEALVELDAVTLFPGEAGEDEPAERPPDPPWPTRKG